MVGDVSETPGRANETCNLTNFRPERGEHVSQLSNNLISQRAHCFVAAKQQFEQVPQQESHESYFLVNEPFVFGESMALSRPTKGSLPPSVVWVVAGSQSRFFNLLILVLG